MWNFAFIFLLPFPSLLIQIILTQKHTLLHRLHDSLFFAFLMWSLHH
jgi:hypothetical protein